MNNIEFTVKKLTQEDQKIFDQIEGFVSLSLEQYQLVFQIEDYWRRLLHFVLIKYPVNITRYRAICCLLAAKAMARIAVTIGEQLDSQKYLQLDVENYWAKSDEPWQQLVKIVESNCPNNWARTQVDCYLIEANKFLES